MEIDARIERLITDMVKESFGEALIESVTIEQDSDRDGDPVMRITVVFDNEKGVVDSHKMAGLVRHVRPKLFEQNQRQFPLFRFVSKRENDRMKRAAA